MSTTIPVVDECNMCDSLEIDPQSTFPALNLTVSKVDFDPVNHFLHVLLSEELLRDTIYELHISFSANITEGLAGYYRSQYWDKAANMTRWMTVTQFEPSDARIAFPCFDEPALKAHFTISLGRSVSHSSISNMPRARVEPM